MGRRLWIVAGVIVTAVLLCGGVVVGRIALGASGQEPERITGGPLGPFTALVLDVDSADVTVAAGDPAWELRTASTKRLVLDQRWEGTTLRLTGRCVTPKGSAAGCGSDLEVTVPAAAEVEIRTGTADTTVSGTRAGLTLVSRSGDFELRDVAGPITAATNSGDITGTGLDTARLDARVNTGTVELAFVSQPRVLDAVTNTGDLTVTVPAGRYRTLTETITGRVREAFAGDTAAASALTLRSSSGDITLLTG